ncbi:MAG: hypothetical protein IJP62_03650 [Treponema sp.]|nr:hypothetical protein [Treponema sp.]
MKRTFLFAFMAMFAVFCFVSCGSDDDSSNDNNSSGDNTSKPDESVSYKISFDFANFLVKSADDQTVGSMSSAVKSKNEQFTADDLPKATDYTIKTGYTLVSWYMDAARTQAFSPFYVTEDSRLYAKFTTSDGQAVPTYVLTYISEYEVEKCPKTTSGVLTAAMLKGFTGYEKYFCGWYYDSNYTQPALYGDTVDKDTTLYAKWIALSDVNPGAGTTFTNHAYPSEVNLYTRTSERNLDTAEYDYTKTNSFSSTSMNYYVAPGVWNFDGAVLYSNKFDRMQIKTKKGALSNLYMSCHSNKAYRSDVPSQVGGSVDMTKIDVFIAVKATGAGTVEASLTTGKSDSDTTPTGVAALVDANGTVLAALKNDTKDQAATLTANVTSAGNVFLVYSRNEDSGGGIYVNSMTFTAPKADYATLTYWTQKGIYYAQMSSKDSSKSWQYFYLDSSGINITRVASASGPIAYGATTGRMYWSSTNETYGYFFFVNETAYHTTDGALSPLVSDTLCTTWTNIAEGRSITFTSDGKVKDDINNISGTYTNDEGVITVTFDASQYIFVYDGSRLFSNCKIFKGPLETKSYSLIWES